MLMMTHAVIVMAHAMVVMRHRLMLGVMPDFLAMQDHFALHAGACDGAEHRRRHCAPNGQQHREQDQ